MQLRIFEYVVLFVGMLLAQSYSAQELNCSVQINSAKAAQGDKAMFDALERSVYEFMNNRRWTNDKFEPSERIECSILITIDEQLSAGQFKASFQVSSLRPIYGSSYTSTLIKFQEEEVQFKYLQFDVLDFSENAYLSELTSLLGYYAYIIIAQDYDTYSLLGGQDYWQMAQRVVSNAQTSGGAGWQSYKNRNNRYWYVQNALNPRFKGLRECNYFYHRKGFDQMAENVQAGRAEVLKALKLISSVHKNEPNSYNVRLFFTAKNDEIIKLFSKAEPNEKNEVISLLDTVDPANSTKYLAIKEASR
ncbi:MAG: DUF4835 family protein [Flavobacteriales bacterium]